MKPKSELSSARTDLCGSTAPAALLRYNPLDPSDVARMAELYGHAELMARTYAADPQIAYLFVWAGAEEQWSACHGFTDPYEHWTVPVGEPIPAGVVWDQTHALLHRTEAMAKHRRSHQVLTQPTHELGSAACH